VQAGAQVGKLDRNPVKQLFSELKTWGKDVVLKKVISNSAYLFGSQMISAVLSILTANLLGVASFGELGVVIAFITNINRLLSFRMRDFVVRYMGGFLAQDKRKEAAAVVKVSALVEFSTAVLAYLVLLILSGWGAANFAKDSATRPLFIIYGIAILGNVMAETATGALQVTGHFKSQALLNLFQSLVTAGLFGVVAFRQGGIYEVVFCGKQPGWFTIKIAYFRSVPNFIYAPSLAASSNEVDVYLDHRTSFPVNIWSKVMPFRMRCIWMRFIAKLREYIKSIFPCFFPHQKIEIVKVAH